MSTSTISVFIVDDHHVFLDGLRLLIQSDRRFNYQGSATNAEDAFDYLSHISNKPDLVICDYYLKGNSGLHLLHNLNQIRFVNKFVFLSMEDSNQIVNQAWENGCDAYLHKTIPSQYLLDNLSLLHAGQCIHHAEGVCLPNKESVSNLIQLSKRETEIVSYIQQGYSSKEISNLLFISRRTVENHRANILRKSGCKNAHELISKLNPIVMAS